MSCRDCSYRVSLEGLKLIDQFRLQKGWKKIDSQWLNSANVSRSTLKRFWKGHRLQQDTFTGICKAVGIEDHGSVADSPNGLQPTEQAQNQTFFITDSPIHRPQLFFGRHDEIRHIFQLLSGYPLQNAAIIGQRRSGKTSLLKHLVEITKVPGQVLRPDQQSEWIPLPTRFNWILVDFQNVYYHTLENLIHYLLVKMGLPIHGALELEGCIQLISEQLSVPTIILLDEIESAFHQRSELDDRFWNGLRFLQQNNGNLAFILSSSTELKQFSHRNVESSS
ncbi:MAG: AAA family ATPase, partial [Phormidesmis sp.]